MPFPDFHLVSIQPHFPWHPAFIDNSKIVVWNFGRGAKAANLAKSQKRRIFVPIILSLVSASLVTPFLPSLSTCRVPFTAMAREKKAKGSTRRKSVYEKNKEKALSAEEVETLYTCQAYEPPSEKQPLETLFEEDHEDVQQERKDDPDPAPARPRRAAATAAKSSIAKGKAEKRLIEFPPFWIEDAAKTKHRQKMAKKGKNRLRPVPLGEADEEKLAKMIQSKEDTLDEEEIGRQLQGDGGLSPPPLPTAATIATATSTPMTRTPKTPFSTPCFHELQLSAATVVSSAKGRRMSSPFMPLSSSALQCFQTNEEDPSFLFTPCNSGGGGGNKRMRTRTRSGKENLDLTGHNDVDFAKVKTPESVARLMSRADVAMSAEELRRRIQEADCFCGIFGQDDDDGEDDNRREEGPAQPKRQANKSRKSVTVSVRRSSRLLRHCPVSGSVYQLAEIEESKLRRKNRLPPSKGQDN